MVRANQASNTLSNQIKIGAEKLQQLNKKSAHSKPVLPKLQGGDDDDEAQFILDPELVPAADV